MILFEGSQGKGSTSLIECREGNPRTSNTLSRSYSHGNL